jgi:hypothetical protein
MSCWLYPPLHSHPPIYLLDVYNPREIDVEVTLSASKTLFSTDEPVLIEVTLKNNEGKNQAHVLDWVIPCEDAQGDSSPETPTEMSLFTIKTARGHVAKYLGAVFKRVKPAEKDYKMLKPGDEVSCTIDLGKNYEFASKSNVTSYDIKYSVSSMELSNPSTNATALESLESNTLTIKIDARKVPTRALRKRKLQSTSFPPVTVQAESYQSMFGVGTVTTSNVGGGQHVAFIDTGDWMSYPVVTLPSTGQYRVEYRVASLSGGGSLRLEYSGGSPVYGILSIPTTGGWRNWQTVLHTVNLSAGSYWFAIFATRGGWNLNWFCISLVTTLFTVTPPPASLNLSPFYTKHFSARGLPVVASGVVTDYTLFEAAYQVDLMLSRRPDILAALIASNTRITMMGYTQMTTDIPEFARLSPKDYWDAQARGFYGSTQTIPVTLIGEEGLLGYPRDPYEGDNIFLHKLAHSIHLLGMSSVDLSYDGRLRLAYNAAMAAGLWRDSYAVVNHGEYFAEGTQSWFDANMLTPANTRALLIAYDPGLAALCREVFSNDAGIYSKPASRLTGHLAGYNLVTAPTFIWPERLSGCLADINKCQLFPPVTVQAESYRSMFGVGTETTSDVGGGQHVAFINTGDWMSYPVVILPSTGQYRVEYRVASLSGGGSLCLEYSGGSPVYDSLSIPTTGGWQNWQTVSHTVNLSAGSYWFAIFATRGGWNLNWFRISLA